MILKPGEELVEDFDEALAGVIARIGREPVVATLYRHEGYIATGLFKLRVEEDSPSRVDAPVGGALRDEESCLALLGLLKG